MTNYVNPYTGATISPSQVGYESLTISTDTELQWPINGNTDAVVANIIEVNATVGGLNLIMPPATQVSDGQSTLIRNVGSNTFTVVNQDLGTIVTIASGVAEYIYVTSNTSIDGTWNTVTFGAGTSAANAATLAGYGLKATGVTLNTATNVTTIASDYLILDGDRSRLLVWTGGAGTMTLPVAADVGQNWFVIIKNDGSGVLNIALQGTDQIDYQASTQLQLSESFVVVSNGANFFSYAYGQSAEFFFTQLVKNVTGGVVTLTAAEGSNIIQEYQGTLTSNCTVVLPPTVQLYSLRNITTGTFTLTFTTGVIGGATLILPQNQTVLAICDGTNVFNAQTATASGLTSITLADGSAASPSLNFSSDLTTGLYMPGSGQLGIAVSGTAAGAFTASGLLLPVGINSGVF